MMLLKLLDETWLLALLSWQPLEIVYDLIDTQLHLHIAHLQTDSPQKTAYRTHSQLTLVEALVR